MAAGLMVAAAALAAGGAAQAAPVSAEQGAVSSSGTVRPGPATAGTPGVHEDHAARDALLWLTPALAGLLFGGVAVARGRRTATGAARADDSPAPSLARAAGMRA